MTPQVHRTAGGFDDRYFSGLIPDCARSATVSLIENLDPATSAAYAAIRGLKGRQCRGSYDESSFASSRLYEMDTRRNAVEKPKGADGLVERAPGDALRDEMHLEVAHLAQTERVRRPAEMAAELRHRVEVRDQPKHSQADRRAVRMDQVRRQLPANKTSRKRKSGMDVHFPGRRLQPYSTAEPSGHDLNANGTPEAGSGRRTTDAPILKPMITNSNRLYCMRISATC